MAYPAVRPQIDDTDKDAEPLRGALHDFAALRLPEWTDRNPADSGALMAVSRPRFGRRAGL